MTNEYNVFNEIKNAKKGSTLYKLIEKMAYKLHELHPNRNSNNNWYTAQNYLESWLMRRWGNYVDQYTPDIVKKQLEFNQKSSINLRDNKIDLDYHFAEGIVIHSERILNYAA